MGLIAFRHRAGSPAYRASVTSKNKIKLGLPRDLTYSSLDLTDAQLSLNHTNDRSTSQSEIWWGQALAKQIDPESSHSMHSCHYGPPPPAAGSALPATSLEGQRVMHRGNTVGAADAGSQCLTHRCFGDCKLPALQVSPWPLHRVHACSTLLRGERGVQCQCFTPLHLAGGTVVIYVYARQNCTMQSQKQWHFLSLGCTII